MITVCEDIKYQIEISFKEGKYKFDVYNCNREAKTNMGLQVGMTLNLIKA